MEPVVICTGFHLSGLHLRPEFMLSGVTVSCFLFSYLVVLAVDGARFAVKVPGRNLLLMGMMSAGLVAHTIFLLHQIGAESDGDTPQLLADWFQWAIVGAWGLAIICLFLIIRNPQGAVSLFMIPLILGLIGVASLVRDQPPFARETTINLWGLIHGVSLLCGTMFICLGMAFGVMYLLQSYRLKSKKRPSKTFRLPALEFLQTMNRFSIFATAVALGIGMISGIILTVNSEADVAWFSVLVSFGLFAWSATASVLELTSRGALGGGRRSPYLNIASFAILLIVFVIMLVSSHGQKQPTLENFSPTIGFSKLLLKQQEATS